MKSLKLTQTGNAEIFIMDLKGGEEKQLTSRSGFDSGARFSPDGSQIAFFGATDEGVLDIFLMKPDGSEIINLTMDAAEDYSPAWSPDGNWIAYTSGTSARYNVWLIHVGTKEKTRLTALSKRNESPAWKPN